MSWYPGTVPTFGHLAELLLSLPAEDRVIVGRFLANIEPDENGCWIWQGEILDNGYGRFCYQGQREVAHRYAYRTFIGQIPDGLVIDHVRTRGCLSRACSNPAHLEPVTNSENVRRGYWANVTHCPSGHEYTPENTRVYRGRRYCRACNNNGGSGRKVLRAKELLA